MSINTKNNRYLELLQHLIAPSMFDELVPSREISKQLTLPHDREKLESGIIPLDKKIDPGSCT